MLTQKRLISPFGRGAVIATIAALALATVVPTEASARARRWHGGGGAEEGPSACTLQSPADNQAKLRAS